MARHEEIAVPANTWTQITSDDVTEISFQNKSRSGTMYVQATSGEVAPTDVYGYEYGSLQGEYLLSLAEAFPGVTDAARVWVYCEQDSEVFVSHA